MNKRSGKIVAYHRPIRITFTGIVFLFIFVYLIFQLVSYLTKGHVSLYQVGTAATYTSSPEYTGVITRNETVYYMDKTGYINYYVQDGKKTYKGNTVYTIDENGNFSKMLESLYDENTTLSAESIRSIKTSLVNDSLSFDLMDFNRVYENKGSLDSEILDAFNQSAMEQISENLDTAGLSEYQAQTSGFLVLKTDTYDALTADAVTSEILEGKSYESQIYKTGEKLDAGSVAYKSIADDTFTITFALSEEDENMFRNNTTLKIELEPLQAEVTGDFSITTASDGTHMGNIVLDKYGSSYLNERYVTFKIKEDSATGIRIPKSAVVEKSFLTIPQEYITKGGNESSDGVYKQVVLEDGTGSVEFVPVTIYSSNETDYYISTDSLQAGDTIVKPGSQETYLLGVSAPLEGVYNANQGFCTFRRIEVLSETNDNGYYIVKEGTTYGITPYDYIVLDASQVEENEIIH